MKSQSQNDGSATVVSLFSGCGGMDLGFIEAGYKIIWANDIDKDACETYKNNLCHSITQGDILDYYKSIPRADLVIGGPPCQSFSLVGKRSKDDPRNLLPLVFLEIVSNMKPKIFIMENVPGLTSALYDGEKFHLYLLKKFIGLGYDCNIMKLIATDYGVPQLRRRVFIIGYKGKMRKIQFPSGIEFLKLVFGENNQDLPISVRHALDDLPPPISKGMTDPKYISPPLSAYASYLRRNDSSTVSLHLNFRMSEKEKRFLDYIPPGGNYKDIPDEISTTRILKFKQSGGRTTTYGRLHPDKPSYTINTYFNRPNVGSNYHYRDKRLITPREALRLQSFPDDFKPSFSSQRSLCAQIGNAVPPLMARAIAEGIKGLLR